jgi:hypothetical protein
MLDKNGLKKAIQNLMTEMMAKESDDFEYYATQLSEAIEAYVKSATINYTAGLVAPSGAVTGVFQGNLQ